MNPPPTHRNRKTRASVILADRIAGTLIRGGGFLIIVAVLGIFVFLGYVVVPLFRDAEVGHGNQYPLPGGSKDLLFAELNEYGSLGMAVHRDGTLRVFNGQTGELVRRQDLLPHGASVTAFSRNDALLAFGLRDGSVILASLRFTARFLADGEVPGTLRDMAPLEARGTGEGVTERTRFDQFRTSEVTAEIEEPAPYGKQGSPIQLVDFRASGRGEVIAVLDGAGGLTFGGVSVRENYSTGVVSRVAETQEVAFTSRARPPSHLLLNSQGDQIYVAWADGVLHRYDLRDPGEATIAEKVALCASDVTLARLAFMLGEQSIIAADSAGGVSAWFRVEAAAGEGTGDGFEVVPAHRLERHDGPVTALAMSSRDKTFATGTAGGDVWVRHMTSERVLARLQTGGSAVTHLQIAPKGDTLVAVTASDRLMRWPITNPHPETSLSTIFGETWYEGRPQPEHSWQSSSGTDDFEPKLGIVPLVFGTLKATLYAMLFSVPIALLAAIYSSEFLSRKARAAIKPTIEMMASLPSVVLGFIAALVLAPLIESSVLSLLAVFFVVPVAVVLAAYLWLCIPRKVALSWEGWRKGVAMVAVFGLSVVAAFPIARVLEDAFFLGDFRVWLAPPRAGTGTAFWAALLLPLSLLAAVRTKRLWLPGRPADAARRGPARELLEGTLTFVVALLLSTGAGLLLTLGGVDPRDSLVGTYVQRNTLIVGFVMGFAVIPIIYTIAEDALSSVPDHLRGAAIGCGATPWQTAVRVVVPTAMSGIFSAVMIGLGRAVGETMIVVMAAGNTPIMDVNPFNGLRSLSATIATELPEAVKDGTLYRMLFLAALTLFAMTFVVNTVAEVVRLRFRKRAFEL